MSLSASAIEKHQTALSELIDTWLKDNPPVELEVSGAATPDSTEEKPKQLVTVALRTRPFLESETADGKSHLPGVHARGQKMFVHVPSAKVYSSVCVSFCFVLMRFFYSGRVRPFSTSRLMVIFPLARKSPVNTFTSLWL